MVKKHTVSPLTLILLISLILAGCAQPGLQANTTETLPAATARPAIKTIPAQTATEIPAKVSPSTLQITPTPSAAVQILDLAYAGRLWALVSMDENPTSENPLISLIIDSSSDGGATWEAHSIPAAGPAGQNSLPLTSRVAFMDQNTGWVFDSGLFQTQDGGSTWKELTMDQNVEAILPADSTGGQNWALAGVCAEAGQDCTYQLMNLDPQAGTLAPLSGYSSLRAGQHPELYRIHEKTALVFAPELSTADQPSESMALWSSDGSGSGWKKLATPCHMDGLFSLSPDGQFWLECGILFSGADEAKGIYVSSDQGATWELRSASGGLIEATPPSDHPLQVFGNVTGLLALSKEEALIGLSHDTLYLSLDEGRDWEGVIPPFGPDDPVDIAGWRLVRKPGSDEIWAAASTQPLSSWLFRSTDRGHSWSKIKTIWP